MKNTIIRTIVVLLVFVGSFALFSNLMNSDNIDKTINLQECSLPTVSTSYKEMQINYLYGYTKEMQGQYMRDTITPLNEQNKLDIQIQTYGENVKQVAFEVRSLDMSRLIEDSRVSDNDVNFNEKENVMDVKLNIQDLLSDGKEYLLIIKLKTDKYENINYYTRIIKDGEYNVKEKLDFALNFHDKTFEKSEEIVTNLESDSSADNSNYNYVNIKSSFKQVTFGNLDIKPVGTKQIQLKELNSETGIINIDYMAESVNSAGETEKYMMHEFYRVRYTKDRMYLLDFERTMDEVFNEQNKVYYNKALSLGISNESVEYEASADGRIVCFTRQGNLYCYNASDNSVAKVYGFLGGDDIRYQNQNHDIKIVNVDESGSTDFIVTGYMARGTHEGQTGVLVLHYDSLINGVEEKLFISSDRSYENLKSEIGDLTYISAKGVLYISFCENVYEISLDSMQNAVLVNSNENGDFKVSKDEEYMSWQQESNDFESKTMNVINFDSGKITSVTVSEEERIKPIGFIGNALVYGIARYSDIEAGGFTVFPMYKIVIMNEKQETVKEYEPSGMFVTDGEIKDNMLNMTRMTYDGSSYNLARSDQIVHSISKEDEKIVLASITTDNKKKEYQFRFTMQLKEKAPNILAPKIVVYDEKEDFVLDIVHDNSKYYVYQKGKLENIYNTASLAFANAISKSGIVVDENQACVYDKIKKYDKHQLEGFPTIGVSGNMDSLTACVSAVLDYYQISADVAAYVAQGMEPLDVLRQELGENRITEVYGQPLDSVLYMVSADYPVIVKLDDKNYGVIVGYDTLNTIVMNPAENKTGYIGMQDSKAMFESAGNVFCGCIK